MATGNVARFMGQNTNDLIRRFCSRQESRVNEQALAAGDEGVDLVIVDDVNPHRRRVQTRRFENGLRVEPQQTFDFRIANQRKRGSRWLLFCGCHAIVYQARKGNRNGKANRCQIANHGLLNK